MATLTTSLNAEREPELFEFTQGIDLDQPLASSEVKVQKAWVDALFAIDRLSESEQKSLQNTYDEALQLIEAGDFPWNVHDEDIHMNLESFVTSKLGELGKSIHYGRSRNDLIATTLRLFVTDNIDTISSLTEQLISALAERAGRDLEVIVPGLTHLQFGQPVRLSQIYLAHAWALKRDLQRLKQAKEMALDAMPLGSAALTGTTLNVDLVTLAKNLGFNSAPKNSYDAVGDRDFMVEALQAYSLLGVHLSRLSEDCIFWSSTSCGWLKLPANWSTGSSIMPNKRNPDVAELVRGKSSQVMAAAQGSTVLLKGLVSSYSSDLHELKRVYQSSLSPLIQSLKVFRPFLLGLEPDRERIAQDLQRGHLLATEMANELSENGVSFREAYQQIAAIVNLANEQKVSAHELPEEQVKELAPKLSSEFLQKLSPNFAVELRTNCGGSSLQEVKKQIEILKN